jgi:hypothetical protein
MAERVRDLDDGELFDSLDWNRSVVVRKLEGLTFDQATALVTPTGVTLLALTNELGMGRVGVVRTPPSGRWPGDADVLHHGRLIASVSDVVDDYHRACARSRAIAAEATSLDVHTIMPHWFFGIVTLRWILLHMIRETARHAGHLDILRELTDGRTGDE